MQQWTRLSLTGTGPCHEQELLLSCSSASSSQLRRAVSLIRVRTPGAATLLVRKRNCEVPWQIWIVFGRLCVQTRAIPVTVFTGVRSAGSRWVIANCCSCCGFNSRQEVVRLMSP